MHAGSDAVPDAAVPPSSASATVKQRGPVAAAGDVGHERGGADGGGQRLGRGVGATARSRRSWRRRCPAHVDLDALGHLVDPDVGGGGGASADGRCGRSDAGGPLSSPARTSHATPSASTSTTPMRMMTGRAGGPADAARDAPVGAGPPAGATCRGPGRAARDAGRPSASPSPARGRRAGAPGADRAVGDVQVCGSPRRGSRVGGPSSVSGPGRSAGGPGAARPGWQVRGGPQRAVELAEVDGRPGLGRAQRVVIGRAVAGRGRRERGGAERGRPASVPGSPSPPTTSPNNERSSSPAPGRR